MNTEEKIVLHTDRLYLREFTDGDFDALYAVLADSDIMRHYPYTFDGERVRRWIAKNRERYRTDGFGLYAVCLAQSGEMIGDCGLTMQNINGKRLPEIGYHIRKSERRRGYAKEAACAVRDFCFTATDFPCVYSYMTADNLPSAATACAYGAGPGGEYIDAHGEKVRVFALEKSAWREKIKGVFLPEDKQSVLPLFAGWEETMIASATDGTMGTLLADDRRRPGAALCEVGAFRLLAGTPCEKLAAFPLSSGFSVVLPQDEAWATLIEKVYGGRATRVTRYATRKDTVFDTENLRKLAATAPSAVSFAMIGGDLYDRLLSEGWSRDFVSSYRDKEDFLRKGTGVVAMIGGVPVAGASSYSSYVGGIEIEVDTRPDMRRRHLATACAARLILSCLARGLYPSWDAQNLVSAHLAENLGYRISHAYPAYEILR